MSPDVPSREEREKLSRIAIMNTYLIHESSHGLLSWTGDERESAAEAIAAAKDHNEYLDSLGENGDGRGAVVESSTRGLFASAETGWEFAPRD